VIEQAHQHVARIAQQSQSNFVRSFAILPPAKRAAMTALYAFARLTDDMGDAVRQPQQNLSRLQQWRIATESALAASQPTENATISADERLVLIALADSCRRYQIPSEHLLGIIDGVIADQTINRYQTWAELRHYCYLVAATVGLACIPIWGCRSPVSQAAAIECGIAFQLTNILRDIREDAANGRIYLPIEHWQKFGVEESDFLAKQTSAEMMAMLTATFALARASFAAGWPVYESLTPEGQRMFSMMWRTYRSLLHELEQQPARILERRISLPLTSKLWLAVTHRLPGVHRILPHP
jgi:phytoene synthase